MSWLARRHGGTCLHCGAVARLLVVAPCAHLFCLDCISVDKQACPSCQKAYLMQSVSEPARLETNPNPKWDVPKDVIEWQPAYTQKVRQNLTVVVCRFGCQKASIYHHKGHVCNRKTHLSRNFSIRTWNCHHSV